MSVARNVVFNPTLVPGGGASELAISVALQARARGAVGAESAVFGAVAQAMEVIPRTLVQNAGGNPIRVLTELKVCGRPLLAHHVMVLSIIRPNMSMAKAPGV